MSEENRGVPFPGCWGWALAGLLTGGIAFLVAVLVPWERLRQ